MDLKFKSNIGKATKIKAKHTGTIQEYAMKLLLVVNNAREYPSEFLKYWNDSGNNIYILTPSNKKNVDEMKDWLERIGYEIVDEEEITTITPVPVYTTWDEELDYAEFLTVEE